MWRILRWALLASVWVSSAVAGVNCTVPFNIQNGTNADASQVMANYNAILTCLGSAAVAGVNNDITQLTALTTPLTPAQGGSNIFTSGVSTGTNSVVVATTVPSNFSLAAGRQVSFVVGSTNTGAATINVAATGVLAIVRRDQFSTSPLVGGELIASQAATVVYDGTQFQLASTAPVIIGEIRDYTGTTAPLGWAFADGSCQLRAGVFASLFSVITTSYDPGSVCDVAHFALPDTRGRVLVAKDNLGGVAANRLTNAGSSCDGTLIGLGCGGQNQTIAKVNLPAYNLTVTDPGHAHTFNDSVQGNPTTSSRVIDNLTGGSFGGAGTAVAKTISINTNTTGITVGSGGSGTALTTIPPLQIVTKIVKY